MIIKVPKPHQLEAVANGVSYFQNNDRGKLIMPCGSGKTLTSLWLGDSLGAKRIIVALPTLNLQSQTLYSWLDNIQKDKNPHDVILIGSDKKIGEEQGFPATTDIKYISEKIKNSLKKSVIVFTTYQSSRILVAAALKYGVSFDYGIFDEAHNTSGFAKEDFQCLIDDNQINIKKRMFMTATPKVFLNNGKGGLGMGVFSMDDEAIYGKEFYRLSIKQAVEEKIICDYKVVTLSTDNQDLVELIKSNVLINDKSVELLESEAKMVAIAISTVKAIQKLNLKKLITFNNTIERAKKFGSILFQVSRLMGTEINIFHINNSHTEKERKAITDLYLASDCAIVTNSRLLGEGADFPAVDGVIFVDERKSVSDIVQAAGRAWRTYAGKEFGYILLPCILDKNNDIEKEDLTVLRQVLSALASSDERMYSYFKNNHFGNSGNRRFIEQAAFVTSFDFDVLLKDLRISVWTNLKKLDGWATRSDAIQYGNRLHKEYGINSTTWKRFCNGKMPTVPKKPSNIPVSIRSVYDLSYKEFFSSNYNNFVSKEQAISYASELHKKHGIYSRNWQDFLNGKFPEIPQKPSNVPASYKEVYGLSSLEFFGIKKKNIVTKENAIRYGRLLNKKYGINSKNWSAFCRGEFPDIPKKPDNIPITFTKTYNISRAEFFGTGKHHIWAEKQEAILYGHWLYKNHGINSVTWPSFCKGEHPGIPEKPKNIPVAYWRYYKISHADFFGNKKHFS